MEYYEKIKIAKEVIKEFYEQMEGNVVVAFSGGKDSTVLLHLVRSVYPEIKAVFFNTTNEFGDIIKFVRKTENIDFVEPLKPFKWTILNKGYPLVSKKFTLTFERLFKSTYISEKPLRSSVRGFIWDKDGRIVDNLSYKWLFLFDRKMIETLKTIGKQFVGKEAYQVLLKKVDYWYDVSRKQRHDFGLKDDTRIKLTQECCYYLKKQPAKKYQNKTNVGFFIGTKRTDSRLRRIRFDKAGYYDEKNKRAFPLQYFTDEDIDRYITEYNLEIPQVYYDFNLRSTGCVMCGFGISFNLDRFEFIKRVLPKRWEQFKNLKNIYSDITFGEAVDLIVETLKK